MEKNAKPKPGKTIILVDYENVHQVDLSHADPQTTEIKIFVGQAQHNIPFDLVQAAQSFGNTLEWIKIEGSGKNALDFHVAFFIGKLSAEKRAEADNRPVSFVIISRVKGFDPLIRYASQHDVDCRRIDAMQPPAQETVTSSMESEDDNLTKAVELIAKIQKNKRPKTRGTLSKYLATHFQKSMSSTDGDEVIASLLVKQKIVEEGKKLVYQI
jgi:hypothetical protein